MWLDEQPWDCAIRFHPNLDTVDLFDSVFRQHFDGRTVAVDLAFAEYDQARKVERGEVEIMQGANDGESALAIQPAQ